MSKWDTSIDLIEKINKFWEDGIGHLSEEQRDFIIHRLEELKPKFCLEIGFAGGRHTSTVLNCCGIVKMVSIDISFDHSNSREKIELIRSHFSDIEFIEGDSKIVLTDEFFNSHFPKGIDYVLVDGGHSFEETMLDMQNCYPYLNNPGLMIVDDYKSKVCPLSSVDQAVNSFSASQKIDFEEVSLDDGKGMAIFYNEGKRNA